MYLLTGNIVPHFFKQGHFKLLNNSSVFFDDCLLLGDEIPLQVGKFASVTSFPSTVGIMQPRHVRMVQL